MWPIMLVSSLFRLVLLEPKTEIMYLLPTGIK